jgi:hypothetical protein
MNAYDETRHDECASSDGLLYSHPALCIRVSVITSWSVL